MTDDPNNVVDAEFTAEAESTQLATVQRTGSVTRYTPQQVIDQKKYVDDICEGVMEKDVHYGVIPGTQKPTLLKAGAEALCFAFQLRPEFSVKRNDLPDGHIEVTTYCTLVHYPTGNVIVKNVAGHATTMEPRYRYRKAYDSPKCPQCGFDLRRGDTEWYCWAKKGGCGAKYPPNQFKSSAKERIENPDIRGEHNTVIRISQKRSLVAATLIATGTSGRFTSDLEDIVANEKAAGREPFDPDEARGAPQDDGPPPQQQQQSQPPRRQAPPKRNATPPRLAQQGNDIFTPTKFELIKQGEGDRGHWELWLLHTEEGHEFKCFLSDNHHDEILGAIHTGARMRIEWQADRRGNRIKRCKRGQPRSQEGDE